MDAIYLLRSGSIKGLETIPDGTEQVIRFYLPGELVGLDGLGMQSHHCSAVALETSYACTLPIARIPALSAQFPDLQQLLQRASSAEIAYAQDLLLLLAQRSAIQRVASFLLSLACRYEGLGYSATDFKLSMSYQDIAGFLGIAAPTLSRILAELRESGLIEVVRRRIQLRDVSRLQGLANPCASCPAAKAA